MTQVHRITLIVVDCDDLGADSVSRNIENARYYNHCVAPRVLETETREIEWSNEHPINKGRTVEDEVARLFGRPAARPAIRGEEPALDLDPLDVVIARIEGAARTGLDLRDLVYQLALQVRKLKDQIRRVGDVATECLHRDTRRGEDVRRGSRPACTQVCVDCGAFRMHGHGVDPDRPGPDDGVSEWRPASQYAGKLAEHRDQLALQVNRLREQTPRPGDIAAGCLHRDTRRGENVPRVHGSWRSQVCVDCGAFRTHGHGVDPDRPGPGDGVSEWRPASEYEEETKPWEDS